MKFQAVLRTESVNFLLAFYWHFCYKTSLRLKEIIAWSQVLINWSEFMAGVKRYLFKVGQGLMICLALTSLTLNVNALEIPGLGNIEMPSFRYGKLKRDRDANRTFQTYKILPDHRYYTSGLSNIPYAIIGVSNKYKLRKGMWREVKMTSPMLRNWVSKMDNIYGYPPYGSVILDDNGVKMGIWYSSKQWTTVIIEENNEIAILTPEPPGFGGGN